MSISKVNRPFRVAKEMHLATIQALIDIYSKTRSYVANLSTTSCMCLLQKIHFQSLHHFFCLTIFHLTSNIVKACQSLGCHILALELDMEVFTKVLKPFVEAAMLELDTEHVHYFEIDSLVKKRLNRLFDYEQAFTCINIMHSFSYLCCMPPTFLSLYL